MSDKPKIFNLEGQVDGIKTRKGDKSLLISIALQETNPVQAGYLMGLQDKHVYFFMAERQFSADEIIALPEPKKEGKKYTRSQQLRFKLHDIHIKKGGLEADFEKYYQETMDKLIESYDKKLKEI
jgi:hypothetical protein